MKKTEKTMKGKFKMGTRSEIEKFIRMYEGTAIGQSVKNMYENGTSLEEICNYIGEDRIYYDGDEE